MTDANSPPCSLSRLGLHGCSVARLLPPEVDSCKAHAVVVKRTRVPIPESRRGPHAVLLCKAFELVLHPNASVLDRINCSSMGKTVARIPESDTFPKTAQKEAIQGSHSKA